MPAMRVSVMPGSLLQETLQRYHIFYNPADPIEIDSDRFGLNHETLKKKLQGVPDNEIYCEAIARTILGRDVDADSASVITVFSEEMKASRANLLNAVEELKREMRTQRWAIQERVDQVAEELRQSVSWSLLPIFVAILAADILLVFIAVGIAGGGKH